MADLARVHVDDIVEVSIKGRKGLAFAAGRTGSGARQRVKLDPITPGFGYFTASGRQVKRHWRLTKNTPRDRTPVQPEA